MLKTNDKKWSANLKSSDSQENHVFTPENFELLLKKTTQQRETIKSLEFSQEILASLCNIAPYSVHIIEAIRNSDNEIVDLKILKIDCNDDNFALEEVIFSSEKDTIWKISDFFGEKINQEILVKEYTTVYEEGKSHWFSSKQSIFKRTKEGLPKQILLITQDITEKKIASIALQENEHFLKSIADSTPDILYVVDLADGKIVYINKAVYDQLGYTPEQIKNSGSSVINLLFLPEYQETVRSHFKSFNIEPHHELEDQEYKLKDAFGEWHCFRCRHSVFKANEKGFVTQLLGIGQNISLLKKIQEERIKIKLGQQRAIFQAIFKTQEEERKRIAEALHNSIGQILYGAKLSLAVLEPEKNSPTNNTLEIKKAVEELLEEAIIETKNISFELMPGILKDFGLETAIEDLLNKKGQKTQLKSTLHLVGLKKRLNPDLEITIFRIVQELINNSIKHAKAQKVDLYINKGSDYININFTDDGIGFNKEILTNQHEGFGLRNINNRVMVLNGKLVIKTNEKKGTRISIEIPLEENGQ